MEYTDYSSPFGKIKLFFSENKLYRVRLGSFTPQSSSIHKRDNKEGTFQNIYTRFLDSYFSGQQVTISCDKFNLKEATTFQLEVYRALKEIEFGSTVSYGTICPGD
ncbi:hypothetical protein AKJ51_00790 [candidate division MSBL1 archaeon SCGC-AAA382A20]|uniref:Methylguanine DNA methyltransferase ribonuclease-like domain-containing protein n=1 Tax=candidate division MSBL1 archaeon SCGC-AAA382A20 TaxID=1698280 RepID=A0A133VMJ8_9EURY|nr:hypothetical protein AKJ51_00790 [candidate division MSBL1 archaeon SCGC-AAA382A20]